MRIGDVMKKNNKKIPVNNYIKLSLIVIGTILAIVLLSKWYIGNREYELTIPIISETLINEINTDEVYDYIRANENAILYIGVVENEECREFEKDFNKVITDRTLEDTITYLNISKVKSKKNFIKEFNKFYDAEIDGYPSLIIFEEGNVKATLTVKTGEELDIDDAIKFLDQNSVVSRSL